MLSLECSCTETYVGFFKLNRAKSFMDLVCVAENRRVCRLVGKLFNMEFMDSSKPKSKMRSASSNTSIFKLSQLKLYVSSMCCKRRPGVQMIMFAWLITLGSVLQSLPPITRPAEKSWNRPTFFNTSNV